jgi:hypothetical protein
MSLTFWHGQCRNLILRFAHSIAPELIMSFMHGQRKVHPRSCAPAQIEHTSTLEADTTLGEFQHVPPDRSVYALDTLHDRARQTHGSAPS